MSKTVKKMTKNKLNYTEILKIAISGVIFTIVCISLVVFIGDSTKDKIKDNQKQQLVKQLNQIVVGFDNDILEDSYQKEVVIYGAKQNLTIYPAKKKNKTFAKLIKHTYPKGYSGDIVILTAVDNLGNVIGSRILKHSETPGLGDKIEMKKSDWMLSFNNSNLKSKIWKVKKNGGDFDSFTGATITPRAIVFAVKELLEVLNAKNI
jgi:electron transport complex protein RnfG